MIFKKSKVLIDNILDPVSGKSLRGHTLKISSMTWQLSRRRAVFLFYTHRHAPATDKATLVGPVRGRKSRQRGRERHRSGRAFRERKISFWLFLYAVNLQIRIFAPNSGRSGCRII